MAISEGDAGLAFGPHLIRILADQPEYGFAEGRFVPGVPGPPPHRHDWDEGFYVVSGQLRVQLGDEEVVLGPGDFALAPGGALHTFAVEGSEEAVFFATFGSAQGLAYVREMSGAFAGGTRPDAEQLMALYSKYGVEADL